MEGNNAAIVELHCLKICHHLWRIRQCDVMSHSHAVTGDCASPIPVPSAWVPGYPHCDLSHWWYLCASSTTPATTSATLEMYTNTPPFDVQKIPEIDLCILTLSKVGRYYQEERKSILVSSWPICEVKICANRFKWSLSDTPNNTEFGHRVLMLLHF